MEAAPSLPTQELASARIDYYKGLAIDSLAQTIRADRKSKLDKKLPSEELVQQAIMHGLDPFRALVDTKSSHALAAAAKLMVGLNEKIHAVTENLRSGNADASKLSALYLQRDMVLENMPPARAIHELFVESEEIKKDPPTERYESATMREILEDVREELVDETAEVIDEEDEPPKHVLERLQVEAQRTPSELIAERMAQQEAYLTILDQKYQLANPDPRVQQVLYELNGSKRGYMEELSEVNSTLPPMSEETEVSIVIPSYNEAGKIQRTMEDWLKQQEAKGKPIKPKAMEFIIVINRPNESKEFDETRQILEELRKQPRYKDFPIHVLEKTFNFSNDNRQITGVHGQPVPIPRGVKMGLIYKYGADLAILRNMQRSSKLRKANHLLRTGGADTYERSPYFVVDAIRPFDDNPYLEQHNLRADNPHEFYRHVPLFHFAYRLNEIMNTQLSQRNSHIGLGTYRAAIYAEAGGFDARVPIAEEVELSRRMRPKMKAKEALDGHRRRLRESKIVTLEDPRRALSAIWSGIMITQVYSNWENEAVRSLPLEKMLEMPVPPEARLTLENVTAQAEAVFRLFFIHLLSGERDRNVGREEHVQSTYNIARRYMKRAMRAMGAPHFEVRYRGDMLEDVRTGKIFQNIAADTSVHVEEIATLKRKMKQYRHRKDPKWMRKRTIHKNAEPDIAAQAA